MLRVIVKVGQAHAKQKPWSLVRDFTGGGEGGGEEEEQVLAVKDDYVGVTSIDAQATRTGPGPEGPGTRPKAKPGSKVGGGGEPCTAFNWRRRGGGELEQQPKEVRRVKVNCGAKPDRARGKHSVTFDRPPATFGRVRR